TWFERHPSRWGFLRAVWELGLSIRGQGYDLGIDVRGDVLTVLVLALGGIPRRIGWAMGGGAFLLTDVARWVPGRHEVRSRLALLEPLGILSDPATRVDVHVADRDRATVARWLMEDWPRKTHRRVEAATPVSVAAAPGPRQLAHTAHDWHASAPAAMTPAGDSEWLHAGRFGPVPPLLAVHIGAGTCAKRWPRRHWSSLIARFLEDGWWVIVVGGPEDPPATELLPPH